MSVYYEATIGKESIGFGWEYRILLKTPWSDGTTSVQVSLLELMERLAAIIPQPRTHQVLYYGVFANNAKYRNCLLYTSPSPRDATLSRMPSSA